MLSHESEVILAEIAETRRRIPDSESSMHETAIVTGAIIAHSRELLACVEAQLRR